MLLKFRLVPGLTTHWASHLTRADGEEPPAPATELRNEDGSDDG